MIQRSRHFTTALNLAIRTLLITMLAGWLISLCPANVLAQTSATTSSKTEKPLLHVFVLAGQSNMQGHAVVDMDHPEHYNGGKGNLVHLLDGGNEKFSHLRKDSQWTTRGDVFVRFKTKHETKTGGLSIGFAGYQDRKHFGPELQFGHVVGEHFDEPILLIKTAWGGKSLQNDFRSPSSVRDRGGEVGEYYTKMMEEVQEALAAIPTEFPALKDHEVKISGFVWQQGWNDMIDREAIKEYHNNLKCLIIDVRREWNEPMLPVVVGELGNGGKKAGSENMKFFRRKQSYVSASPMFVGNVLFAPTTKHARPAEESPNVGHLHHWYGNAESYLGVGDELGKQMLRLHTQPNNPRVLLLGDSISIGYMPYVKQAMDSKAFVVRPMANHFSAENCEGTDKGIRNIGRWLKIGGGKWDVIHFNFGLHDLKHVDPKTNRNSNKPTDPEQSPPEDYEQQLREIVAKLKETGAELVFATTTPVPEGGVKPYRDPEAPSVYNEIAKRVMAENGVAINDLFSIANQQLSEIQKPVDVHFTGKGSKAFGTKVTEAIEGALKRKTAK